MSEKPSIWVEPDHSLREAATARIRDDLANGVIDRLTFRSARNDYGVTSQTDIRQIQHDLRKEGILVKKGNRFLAASIAA